MKEMIKFKECLLIDEVAKPATTSSSGLGFANKNMKKYEALMTLRTRAKQPIFIQVMRSLFVTKDFYKIRNASVQIDLLENVSKNGIVDLIDNLVKLRRDNEYR